MFFKPSLPFVSDSSRIHYSEFKEKLLDRLLFTLMITIAPVYLLVVNRSVITGWTPVHTFQSFLFLFFISITLFRKKIVYTVKAYFLIGFWILLLIAGFYRWGLYGAAPIGLVVIPVYALAFLQRKEAVIVSFLCIFISVSFGLLYSNRMIEPLLVGEGYIFSGKFWGVIVGASSMFIISIIYILGESFNELISLINQVAKTKNDYLLLNNSLERKVADRTDQLDEALRTKNDELAIVIHDIRSPIGTIRSIGQLLDKRVRQESYDAIPKLSGYIQEATDKALAMVNDLMVEEKERSKDDLAAFDSVDLESLLNEVVVSQQYAAVEKNIKVYSTDFTQKVTVRVEEVRFSRVLENLVGNAIKFSKNDSEVNITHLVDEEFITLSIKDRGVGIPEDLQKYLFHKNSKAGRSGTSGEISSGLGLYIAKKIVEEYQGEIGFESVENQGATFFVKLPIVRTTE